MISVQISLRGRAIYLVDSDGDRHVARSPADLWALVRDLAGQPTTGSTAIAIATPAPVSPKGGIRTVSAEPNAEPGPEETMGIVDSVMGRVGVAGIDALHRLSAGSRYTRGGRGGGTR